ncbi:MAG: formate dehydrogenase accessory sulfurtransferase FdhD [Acidobacteriota bacterium]
MGLKQVRVDRSSGRVEPDWVAVEEPLEIRVDDEPLVVTMRTPGSDSELAAGFLFTEGIVDELEQIEAIEPCKDPLAYDPDNVIFVRLREDAHRSRERAQKARRDFTAVAACGLCGKARLEDVYQRLPAIRPVETSLELLRRLPERMRRGQTLFERSGGIHAAALFDLSGAMLGLEEDVGRHNAVDKLVGRFLLAKRLPLQDHILLVSARAGFEIVQKALMAGVPILGTVGAASSLAVSLAQEGGMALYSFLGNGRGHRYV